jgi:fatty-acid desaturase
MFFTNSFRKANYHRSPLLRRQLRVEQLQERPLLGQLWGGVGLSWLVWRIFVRTTLLYHATWLVNSAAHLWGYRSHDTRDRSTNLWWVAVLTLGEGWHNTTTLFHARRDTVCGGGRLI